MVMPEWGRITGCDACDADIDDLARLLGPRLVTWLTDAALRRTGRDQPRPMRLLPGEFGVLLCPASAAVQLQSGLVLPCRWIPPPQRGSPSRVDRVPRRLRELADGSAVRLSAMRCIGRAKREVEDFVSGAQLAVGDGIENLSDFEMSPESAGAALATTLALAALGVSPRQQCAVSATVDPSDGLGRVSDLPAKVDAARRAGIQQVFVASGQEDCPDGCTLIDGPNASAQLGSLMLKLDAPPMVGNDEAKWKWYERVSKFQDDQSKQAAQQFYARELAAKAAESARASVDGMAEIDELILIATGTPEGPLASIALHRPRQVLILTINARSVKYASQLIERCGDLPADILPDGLSSMSLQDWLRTGSTGTDRSRQMLDVTGGTTASKVRAVDHARKLGMLVSCLDSSSDDGFARLTLECL